MSRDRRIRVFLVVLGLLAGVLAVVPTLTGAAPSAAAAAAAGAPRLRVGTFNVRQVGAPGGAAANERPWRERRRVVINQILRARLQVVGIQEASQNPSFAAQMVDGENQYLDLVGGLNRAGGHYRLTQADKQASRGTRILYDTRVLRPVRVGSRPFQHQSARPNDTRYLVWAVFQHLSSGKRFLFANTHLGVTSRDLQRNQWQELVQRIQELREGLPAVVVGDFQGSKWKDPASTMMVSMRRAGYGDALGQHPQEARLPDPRPTKVHRGWVNTVNGFRRDVSTFGYTTKRDWPGNGPDWIFAANEWKVRNYEVVVNMRKLRLVGTIPSDHNLVRATLEMR